MNIKEIPEMKLHKVQSDLPCPKNTKEPNELVFLFSKETSDIHNIFNHSFIKRRAKYHNYYIEDMYKGHLYKRRYYVKKYIERKEYYLSLKRDLIGIRPVLRPNGNKANIFVDLLWYNDIFFDRINLIPLNKRCNEFVKYYKSIINKPIYNGFNKCVLINVQDWTFTKSRTLDDPLSIMYFMMKRKLELIQSLGDIDIIFYAPKMILRINPSRLSKTSYLTFRTLLIRMNPSYEVLNDEAEYDKLIEKQEKKVEAMSSIIEKNTKKFIGGDGIDDSDFENEGETSVEIAKIMAQKEISGINDSDSVETIEDKIIEEISKDKTTLEKIYSKVSGDMSNKSAASLKRDEIIREEHKKVKINNMTLEEVLRASNTVVSPKIPTKDVSNKVKTPNRNVTEIKYPMITKTYLDKVYESDIAAAFDSLSKKEIPLYIIDIKIEDGSDKFNYVDTWTVVLEDTNRTRHTIKVDIPKPIDHGYLYLGGSKKQILNQEYFKPIVKVKEDEVQLVSSYNKIFVRREGNKLSSSIEQLKKVFSGDDIKGITITRGNAGLQNKEYMTHIDYDELAKIFISLKVNSTKTIILFNQNEIMSKIKDEDKKKLNNKNMCIGFKDNGSAIIIPLDGDFNLVDYLCDNIFPESVSNKIKTEHAGSRYMWSSATLMAKKVPLIILLGFFEGITSVMKKANMNISFSDNKPEESLTKDYIKFADCYLVYEKTNNISFLMNPLKSLNPVDYNFDDFNDRAVYINILENVYGHRNVVLAFCNYYNSMVDNIMESICRKLNYPTDIVSLLLHCNKLLSDNNFLRDVDLNNYRIRQHEIIPAILYKEIANAYGRYYATAANKRPVKVSLPRNIVIKNLVNQKTVEGVNFLNPIASSDRMRTVTPKGYVGTNLDDAYKLPNRTYHDSMLGIIGLSTPTDANCGKIRIMSVSPNIVDARGFMDIKDKNNKKDMQKLKDANIMTAAEMSTVGAARFDDSTRTGMMTKQSGHLLPTIDADPVLVSNGFEQTIQYQLPSEYAIIAEDDGEVIEVNEKLNLTFIRYKDSTVKAIDTSNRIDKNGGGGFHLSNHLVCNLKVGDKVQKDDIIAYDSKFFRDDLFGNRMCIGTLCKVAIYSSYSTFEDSTRMTEGAAEKMASYITKEESLVLDKNSNVDFMVNIGDTVEVGDELITFETGYDEAIFNDFLISVGEKFSEEITSIGKQKVESHYQGRISDIKIYAGCDIEEMSPSLQKIMKKYYSKINAKKKALENYNPHTTCKIMKCGMLFTESTEKIDTTKTHGKIKGFDVDDGILILFYIEYKDIIGVGDKITNYSAIKSTVGEIIPQGVEPFSLFRPNEPIEVFLPSSSVLKRMSKSAPTIGFENKVLVELKRKLADMYYDRQYPSDVF